MRASLRKVIDRLNKLKIDIEREMNEVVKEIKKDYGRDSWLDAEIESFEEALSDVVNEIEGKIDGVIEEAKEYFESAKEVVADPEDREEKRALSLEELRRVRGRGEAFLP